MTPVDLRTRAGTLAYAQGRRLEIARALARRARYVARIGRLRSRRRARFREDDRAWNARRDRTRSRGRRSVPRPVSLLEVDALRTGYGRIEILHRISLRLELIRSARSSARTAPGRRRCSWPFLGSSKHGAGAFASTAAISRARPRTSSPAPASGTSPKVGACSRRRASMKISSSPHPCDATSMREPKSPRSTSASRSCGRAGPLRPVRFPPENNRCSRSRARSSSVPKLYSLTNLS